jgi:hypothetical protein
MSIPTIAFTTGTKRRSRAGGRWVARSEAASTLRNSLHAWLRSSPPRSPWRPQRTSEQTFSASTISPDPLGITQGDSFSETGETRRQHGIPFQNKGNRAAGFELSSVMFRPVSAEPARQPRDGHRPRAQRSPQLALPASTCAEDRSRRDACRCTWRSRTVRTQSRSPLVSRV